MADHQDCQVGGAIIGALEREVFAADGAFAVYFEIAFQQGARAAFRTFAAPAFEEGGLERGEDLCSVGDVCEGLIGMGHMMSVV